MAERSPNYLPQWYLNVLVITYKSTPKQFTFINCVQYFNTVCVCLSYIYLEAK